MDHKVLRKSFRDEVKTMFLNFTQVPLELTKAKVDQKLWIDFLTSDVLYPNSQNNLATIPLEDCHKHTIQGISTEMNFE